MINLELNNQESLILVETLQSFLSDLSYEISNTDLQDYREQLKTRRVVLEKIKSELEQGWKIIYLQRVPHTCGFFNDRYWPKAGINYIWNM